MYSPIGMKRIESASIWCWAHYMILNFETTHDIDFGFSRSNIDEFDARETV